MEIVLVDTSRRNPLDVPLWKRRRASIRQSMNMTDGGRDRLSFARETYEFVAAIAGVSTPLLNFRRRNSKYSSGTNWSGLEITIRCGSLEKDIQHVVAHEVAHSLTQGHGHDVVFFKTFFELTQKCGFDMKHAIWRSKNYKKRASTKVLASMNLSG